MTTPVCMGVPQHQSLPMLGGFCKRVIIPDTNGIDRPHPVSDATLDQVRAVIEAAESGGIVTSGLQQLNMSLGSLLSASSNFSSVSSLGSATSAGVYNRTVAR